jgi:hypothetical protein
MHLGYEYFTLIKSPFTVLYMMNYVMVLQKQMASRLSSEDIWLYVSAVRTLGYTFQQRDPMASRLSSENTWLHV